MSIIINLLAFGGGFVVGVVFAIMLVIALDSADDDE